MEKKAQVVGFLVLLALGSLFSIEVLANDPVNNTVDAELDQINNAESSGQITPEKAQQLRQEVQASLQQQSNIDLQLQQFQEQQVYQGLTQNEANIKNATQAGTQPGAQ